MRFSDVNKITSALKQESNYKRRLNSTLGLSHGTIENNKQKYYYLLRLSFLIICVNQGKYRLRTKYFINNKLGICKINFASYGNYYPQWST